MSRFSSLLLPLDGSAESAKAARCALWLAEALGGVLHVVHARAQLFADREALARLHAAGAQRPRVVLHQSQAGADRAILEAIEAHAVGLVIMSARGESAAAGRDPQDELGATAQAVLERSPTPVVLLPARYRETLPWKSMLAAASGEAAADRALRTAAQLAAALRLEVSIVHSADDARRASAAYADAPHHEYGGRLDEIVARGLAGCTAEEGRCVHGVLLRAGDPAEVLLAEAAQHASSVLALGWHGGFAAGRAPVLKRLLREAQCALLVARSSERSQARLKVGKEIEGAEGAERTVPPSR